MEGCRFCLKTQVWTSVSDTNNGNEVMYTLKKNKKIDVFVPSCRSQTETVTETSFCHRNIFRKHFSVTNTCSWHKNAWLFTREFQEKLKCPLCCIIKIITLWRPAWPAWPSVTPFLPRRPLRPTGDRSNLLLDTDTALTLWSASRKAWELWKVIKADN